MPGFQEEARLAQEELSRCVLELLLTEPFYGHFLGGISRSIDPVLPTAAVCFFQGHFELRLNASWFLKTIRDRKTRIAIIKHEALHILLQHATRFNPGLHDRFRYGLAADLVVNQLIGRWPLPADALTTGLFPNFPTDLSLDGYDRLLNEADLGEWVLESRHSDHRYWGTVDEIEASLARAEAARLLDNAMQKGKIPGKLAGLLAELVENQTTVVDWRRILQHFARGAKKTALADTLRRPSRRYHTWPGTRIRHQWWVVVALDTSGSISSEHLARFLGEIQALYRAGAEITLLECDTEIQRASTWKGQPPSLQGRGGTLFDPVFRWLKKQPRPPDACIYLTDGRGPTPTQPPPCPLLWVLCPDGAAEALCYGRILRMSDGGSQSSRP